MSDSVALGVTGKMIWGPTNLLGPEGQVIADRFNQDVTDRFNNVDVGVFYNIGALQMGAVTHNCISESVSMNQFREFSVGGRLNWQQAMFFSFAGQGKISDGEPEQYSLGAEYVSPHFFSLQGGFRILPYKAQSFWSAGASFNSPRMALHYAVEFPNQTVSQMEHTFGATLLF